MVELYLLYVFCLNLVYFVGLCEYLFSFFFCCFVDFMVLVWVMFFCSGVGNLFFYYGGNCVFYLKGGVDMYYDNYN